MKVLGIHIATGQIRYSVLEGTKACLTLIAVFMRDRQFW